MTTPLAFLAAGALALAGANPPTDVLRAQVLLDRAHF